MCKWKSSQKSGISSRIFGRHFQRISKFPKFLSYYLVFPGKFPKSVEGPATLSDSSRILFFSRNSPSYSWHPGERRGAPVYMLFGHTQFSNSIESFYPYKKAGIFRQLSCCPEVFQQWTDKSGWEIWVNWKLAEICWLVIYISFAQAVTFRLGAVLWEVYNMMKI